MLLLLAVLIQGLASTSLYDFQVLNIKGEKLRLSKYAGSVAVVLNVASYWGNY